MKCLLCPNIQPVKVKLNVPQSSGSEGSLCYSKAREQTNVSCLIPKRGGGGEGGGGAFEGQGGAGRVKEGFWRG